MELVLVFVAGFLASLAGLQNIIAYFYLTKRKLNLILGVTTLIIVAIVLIISCIMYYR